MINSDMCITKHLEGDDEVADLAEAVDGLGVC